MSRLKQEESETPSLTEEVNPSISEQELKDLVTEAHLEDEEERPCYYYTFHERWDVKLDSPVEYSEWIEVIEEAINRYEGPWAYYNHRVETYDKYGTMTETRKKEFIEKIEAFIQRLVDVSITKRVADKILQMKVPEGRQQVEFLKKYMTSNEEKIVPAILQFVRAIDPNSDVSPLKRYMELEKSQYIALSDHHKARLLYAALGEPISMEEEFEGDRSQHFRFRSLEDVIDQLEDKYQRRKHVSRKRRRSSDASLFCYFCHSHQHLEKDCFQQSLYSYDDYDE